MALVELFGAAEPRDAADQMDLDADS
jgi:hypothetical protein